MYMYMHVYSTKDEGCAYMCMKQAKEETNLHTVYMMTHRPTVLHMSIGVYLYYML